MANSATMSEQNVNTLKCANCNIVISELLSFIQNKISVIDNESLIRICATTFSEEEVECAKNLLFASIKTNMKKVSRRKNGKLHKDLEDMICVFKVTEPDLIPIFVARDLHRLPPVTFDHVDVTKLLKDLLILRTEINEIKNSYVTTKQLDELKLNLERNQPPASLLTCNINTKKRGGYVLDSGPIGLLPAEIDTITASQSEERTESPKYRYLAHAHKADVGNKDSACGALMNSKLIENVICTDMIEMEAQAACHAGTNTEIKQPTIADIAKKGEWKTQNAKTSEWVTVQNRRYRNRFDGKIGKAATDNTEKFKAAEVKIPLFITNVNKETAEEDVCKYIKNKTSEVVSLEKIKMKKERPYNAYKILCK